MNELDIGSELQGCLMSFSTANGSAGLTTSRSEDEVDLLKDLLVKNLHASGDPKFCGICSKCNENIIGAETGLRAMENLYHVSCFNCVRCGKRLVPLGFIATWMT